MSRGVHDQSEERGLNWRRQLVGVQIRGVTASALVLVAPRWHCHVCVDIGPRLAWYVGHQLRTARQRSREPYIEQARAMLHGEPRYVRLVRAWPAGEQPAPASGTPTPPATADRWADGRMDVRFELVVMRDGQECAYPVCVAGAVGWVIDTGLPLVVEQPFLARGLPPPCSVEALPAVALTDREPAATPARVPVPVRDFIRTLSSLDDL